jgi:hypothetical protein
MAQITLNSSGVASNGVLKLQSNGTTDAVTIGTDQAATFVQAANLPNTFGFKNRIINGAMVIDQRNAGASVTPSDGAYTLDRWQVRQTVSSKFSVQQSTVVPNGFKNSALLTSLSAYSVASGNIFGISQSIEGFNVADLNWGTANASTVTLSFWVRSSLTGTFGGAIKNGGGTRAYPFTYTISAANTWEQKSITIAGDTTGTWATDNSAGIKPFFSIGSGSSQVGTAGAWASADFYGATGETSVVGTNGATFYITGVQLEKGSTATSFDYRPYGTELQLAQRYFEKIPAMEGATVPSGQVSRVIYGFKVTKRASPTITLGTSSVGTASPATEAVQLSSSTAGAGPYFGDGGATAASEL